MGHDQQRVKEGAVVADEEEAPLFRQLLQAPEFGPDAAERTEDLPGDGAAPAGDGVLHRVGLREVGFAREKAHRDEGQQQGEHEAQNKAQDREQHAAARERNPRCRRAAA